MGGGAASLCFARWAGGLDVDAFCDRTLRFTGRSQRRRLSEPLKHTGGFSIVRLRVSKSNKHKKQRVTREAKRTLFYAKGIYASGKRWGLGRGEREGRTIGGGGKRSFPLHQRCSTRICAKRNLLNCLNQQRSCNFSLVPCGTNHPAPRGKRNQFAIKKHLGGADAWRKHHITRI